MVLLMKEIGKTIFNMEKELNSGMIILVMKANISKVKNTDLEAILGRTDHNTQVFGKKTKSTEMEDTHGMTEENIKVTGKTIIWMDMEHIHGRMGGNMRVNTHETKNTAKEYTLGPMEGNMMVNGKMDVNMDKVNIFLKRDSSEKVSGIMVKEKNGLTKKRTINELISNPIILFLKC